MEALVASAAAGAGFEIVFEGFLKTLWEVMKSNSTFKPKLKQIEKTVKTLKQSISRVEAASSTLDQPRQEIDGLRELMIKGEDLIIRCSKIKKYDFVSKHIYIGRLERLDQFLQRYISIDMQLMQTVDLKEINEHLKQLTTGVLTGKNGILVKRSSLSGVCCPPGLKVNPVGIEIPLKELKRKLLDENVPLIVLSAPGGCGKTTLATALCQDEDVKGKFNIFFVTVSKPANMLGIVRKLLQHNGVEAEFQSEEDAINQLENVLRSIGPDPILLVLDDVWSESESLLDKFKFTTLKDYKILVTSRSEFRRFDSTYKLETLSDIDAMKHFHDLAPPPNGISPYDVEKIVKSCNGYPLAISVVAKSLSRKPLAEWRKRVQDSLKVSPILSNSELQNCLQRSVDALDDSVKECYMDLGSFPEDQRIPASTLIDMWEELHNVDDDEAIVNLHKLSDCNLVELLVTRKDSSDDDVAFDSYNENLVMQHDLLRELAILQSNSVCIEYRKRLFVEISGNEFPSWWMEHTQLLINANLLSVSTDETFSSNWYTMQAPEVQVLVLNFRMKNYMLPQFMETMGKLKVLVVANYGFHPAEFSNFQLLGSLFSLTRVRLEKVSLPSSFLTSVQWKNLKKISLVMCNIGQAFSKLAFNILNVFPKLLEINIDYCNDLLKLPRGLCDLVHLKRLSVTNCHKLSALPAEIGKLVNLEVLRLNSCIELSELPETIGSLRDLKILDLSYCLSIKRLPEQIGDLNSLEELYMIDCSGCELPSSVEKLVNLREVIGDEETADSWKCYHMGRSENLKIKVHKDVSLNWLR